MSERRLIVEALMDVGGILNSAGYRGDKEPLNGEVFDAVCKLQEKLWRFVTHNYAQDGLRKRMENGIGIGGTDWNKLSGAMLWWPPQEPRIIRAVQEKPTSEGLPDPRG